ncbi:XRE family transcriptional regulator [Spongiactinospora gelatinilytica]|uniref:XRE family transcriptional regulator n=1 Tax=Spongiactinospora gelatinilytica TaxID=2666298 RepID=A0A2W2FVV3_9ACTN|nr:helix-turn-helix domain-containing protein [Spongiactinospora gelatinilytica]PZG29300.1 XRE family transcriptional regulator [Spongiactinospora gelatinilytica]
MKQEGEDLDGLVRKRIRGLRAVLGWSLDDLAARCYLSPSTLSRIETGHRRIGLDQLTVIARALGTTLDQLVESVSDDDVVIRPRHDAKRGVTTWSLSRDPSITVAKMRITRPAPASAAELKVHPGKDWIIILSGVLVLMLGERRILVEPGQGAEFSTMIPHGFGAYDGPVEVIGIFDPDGRRTHLRPGR